MHRGLPSGVVTLLFTDIEGSTQLLQELGQDYGSALAAHRRTVRDAYARFGGVEVDTQGDSFLVAFARASDAVAAATDAQNSLAGGPVKVRMGLHTGEPRADEDGYVGIDLHRGARIATAGHGGQVLLSESTRALINVPVRDLGHHRLKDISAPEHIYQLEIDGLPSDFPRLRTLEAGRSNLPAAVTSFVGREQQLLTLDDRLDSDAIRLVTLVGPGGAGKSRLAVEAARRRADRYQHGVFHIPLVEISDSKLISLALAESVGLAIDTMYGPDRTREEQVLGYLAERSMLLVLDNFEHLLGGTGFVQQIGHNAPGVDLLVTSRERLGLQGEWVLEVPGLDEGSEALFAERARQSDQEFALDDANRPYVQRICALVEHMPLGIELAAAWTAMLSPEELARELERNLDVLTASQRDVPQRHRSLRAVFEGSWALMSVAERAGFSRLSVFRGTFTREAARAVADVDLGLLAALVDKSLVRRVNMGRFELHELARQYAAEALLADEGQAEATRDSHARWFTGLLSSRVDRLRGADMLEARDEIRLDLSNVREATAWAAAHWSTEEAHRLFADVDAFYMAHSWSEGAEMFDALAEARASRRDAAWLRARSAYASRLAALNQVEASETVASEAIGLLRDAPAAGDPWDIAQCLFAMGTNACNRDEYGSAVSRLSEARTAALESGDAHVLCWVDVWLGWAEIFTEDLPAARGHFDEALSTAEATGSPVLLAYTQSKLGILADEELDYSTALRYHLQTNESFEKSGDRPGVGYAMARASYSAYWLGDYEAALRYGRAALEAFSEISHSWGETISLCRVGFGAIGLGDLGLAQSSFIDALSRARRSGLRALAIHAVSGIGVVVSRQGDLERGASIVTAALAVEGLPSVLRRAAELELETLTQQVSGGALAAARQAAATHGVDQIADELLGQADAAEAPLTSGA